jgi:DNA-binding response OmpR family regulator
MLGDTFPSKISRRAFNSPVLESINPNEVSMPPRILCVEDHPDIAGYLKVLLEDQGYEVMLAGSSAQGFTLSQLQAFDLILLDNGLPDGTGLDLCQRIYASDKRTPIIFHTAGYDRSLKSRAFEAGARGYVKKGAGFDVLLSAISSHLGKEPTREPELLARA